MFLRMLFVQLRIAPSPFSRKHHQLFRDRLILTAPGQDFALSLHAECVSAPSKIEVTATTNVTEGEMTAGCR